MTKQERWDLFMTAALGITDGSMPPADIARRAGQIADAAMAESEKRRLEPTAVEGLIRTAHAVVDQGGNAKVLPALAEALRRLPVIKTVQDMK